MQVTCLRGACRGTGHTRQVYTFVASRTSYGATCNAVHKHARHNNGSRCHILTLPPVDLRAVCLVRAMTKGCQAVRVKVQTQRRPEGAQCGSLEFAGLYIKFSNLQTGVVRAPLSGLHVSVGLRTGTVLIDTLSSCSHAAEGGSGLSSAVLQLQMRLFATSVDPGATARG